MNKQQMKDILDRVLTWSSDRQDDAAEILTLMEAQDQAGFHLTDEQVQEVERRRRDGSAKHLTLDEFNARVDRLLGR
ncbi:hypothetical protein [Bradyrhizobium sp. HKCCYLS20291]|uniref:hypothetical protein n=1 Tax=Bradyrhizobium sp. HKCCYLS20291 TaxID=3420766 RepID=UPI003EBC6052